MTGLVAISIAGVTWLSVNRERQNFQRDLQNQADILLETIEVSVSDALYSKDGDFLDDLIQAIGRESSLVLGGRIYDNEGWILGDANDPAALYSLEPDPFARQLLIDRELTVYQWKDDCLVVGQVIGVNGHVLGAIRLELSTAELQQKIDSALQQGFQAAVASMAIGTLLAFLIGKSITDPLKSMVRATQDIAKGDLTRRLEKVGGTELESLAGAFNRMTSRLYLNLLRKGELLRYALDPIMTLDASGRIVEFNNAAEQVFAYKREEAIGQKLAELAIAEPWQQQIQSEIESCPTGLPTRFIGQWTEILAQRRNGQTFYADFSMSCLAVEGVTLFTVMVRDITDRKQMEGQLKYEALHDPLTGLYNRSGFNQCLDEALQQFKQGTGLPFALLFIDFDRFKAINDSLGHDIGDLLLQNVARRLESCVRQSDRVARLGGGEFTILLKDIDNIDRATWMCNRILKKLASPFHLSGHHVSITVSIGVVLSSAEHATGGEILRDADITMYSAKAAGKAQYRVFDTELGNRAREQLQLERDLHRAIERQELTLNYQPIVASKSKNLVGFEALLRWHHSSRGNISPAQFIPIAEESGAILAIGWWVVQEGCRQMVKWQEKYPMAVPPYLSVNLSGKQIAQPDLVPQVQRILQNTGFSPTLLKLEITETILMDNFQVAFSQLSALQQLGIKIYIDDFGTGYSSFSYLNQLPIDALKIDRSFISARHSEGNNWKIVQTILSLTESMGIDAIAEGVEGAEQAAKLKILGCEYLQGYFIAKPLDVPSTEAFVAANSLASSSTPAQMISIR